MEGRSNESFVMILTSCFPARFYSGHPWRRGKFQRRYMPGYQDRGLDSWNTSHSSYYVSMAAKGLPFVIRVASWEFWILEATKLSSNSYYNAFSNGTFKYHTRNVTWKCKHSLQCPTRDKSGFILHVTIFPSLPPSFPWPVRPHRTLFPWLLQPIQMPFLLPRQ